jgi:hypothetical protein
MTITGQKTANRPETTRESNDGHQSSERPRAHPNRDLETAARDPVGGQTITTDRGKQ